MGYETSLNPHAHLSWAMGGILRGIGFLIMGILALPMFIMSMILGLFFIGAEKADKAVENQLGEPYAKARDSTLSGVHRALVAFIVIGAAVAFIVTCAESVGRRNRDCEWTSHGESCGPG